MEVIMKRLDRSCERLRDILTELGYRNDRGFETQLISKVIERETLHQLPHWRLVKLVNGQAKVSPDDMRILSEGLRFDIRWFFYRPDEVPTYRIRRPRAGGLADLWNALPPTQ